MVIKILAGGSSFNGVTYSEGKIEENKAKLLASENFPFPEQNEKTFRDFFDSVSSGNSRVKNKQFHASISTKGKDHNFEELKDVAERYLQKMGYSNNPYLIYAHTDSPNNHVHIVSSRVDMDGKRISDSLEKVRTQKFIENDLKVNFSKNVDQHIDDALKYNFKSIEPFSALLKKQGYSTREKKGFEIIKSGKVQRLIPKRELKTKMYLAQLDFNTRNKIKAQLHKYSTGSNFDNLKSAMHKKFGLEMIYSYSTKQNEKNAKGRKSEVLGYSLLDHKNSVAYHDSDLVLIEELQAKFDTLIDKKDLAKEIQAIKSEPGTYSDTKAFFKDLSLKLDYDGSIKTLSGEEKGHLDSETMYVLKYNQRVKDANSSNHTAAINENVLSKLFRVNIKDIKPSPTKLSEERQIQYRDYIDSYLNRNKDAPRDSKNIRIYNTVNGPVLVDHKKAVVLDIEKDLNISMPEQKMEKVRALDAQEKKPDYPSNNLGYSKSILSVPMEEGIDEPGRKRKRKRQNDINI